MSQARLIQVTLGAGATQISATPAYFNQMTVSNSAGHVARLGDSTVTSSKGVQLAASNAVNSVIEIGPFSGQAGDASQFYLYGTTGDLIDVLLV